MRWTPMKFGKHEFMTLPQILFLDPDYFFWAYEKSVFKFDIITEAQEIYEKATAIRVPQIGAEKTFVEYIVDAGTKKFGTLRIVTGDLQSYKPMTRNLVLEVIDMRVPRQICKRDRTGYKTFLCAMKGILFGDPSHRMNQQRSEEFFENEDNFDLPKSMRIHQDLEATSGNCGSFFRTGDNKYSMEGYGNVTFRGA
jgi:hypothetical protein